MTVVVDASVVVAALVDGGTLGRWAESILTGHNLAAPHIMPVEVANILRRAELAGDISMETASLAHADLLELSVNLFPYDPFGTRVWELRLNLTANDAWYVALAEALEVNLATLDSRLARTRGPRCRFVLPDR
ncbi:MAG: PIN domain-containing protein [Acidobacteriota bacterium]